MPELHEDINISIIWDFDQTLTPKDSTSEFIKTLVKTKIKDFWDDVKEISKVNSNNASDSISTSEAPVWMHLLSLIVEQFNIKLDQEFMKAFITKKDIPLYYGVINALTEMKSFSEDKIFKKNRIKIHHFIITAGLQDLVSEIVEHNKGSHLINQIFGCKYNIRKITNHNKSDEGRYVNMPIYCMDKTTKTRSLFEIHKGCFSPERQIKVDDLVPKGKEWCPFENMIYIGDGDTDIPAFSLIQDRGGMAIGVYNPKDQKEKVHKKVKNLVKDKRLDLLTGADFSKNSELFKSIEHQCHRIAQRYQAHKFPSLQ